MEAVDDDDTNQSGRPLMESYRRDKPWTEGTASGSEGAGRVVSRTSSSYLHFLLSDLHRREHTLTQPALAVAWLIGPPQ